MREEEVIEHGAEIVGEVTATVVPVNTSNIPQIDSRDAHGILSISKSWFMGSN